EARLDGAGRNRRLEFGDGQLHVEGLGFESHQRGAGCAVVCDLDWTISFRIDPPADNDGDQLMFGPLGNSNRTHNVALSLIDLFKAQVFQAALVGDFVQLSNVEVKWFKKQ